MLLDRRHHDYPMVFVPVCAAYNSIQNEAAAAEYALSGTMHRPRSHT